MDRSDFAACAACVALALITIRGAKADIPCTVAGTPALLARNLPAPASVRKADIQVATHAKPIGDDLTLQFVVAKKAAAEISAIAGNETSEAAGEASDASAEADAAKVSEETPRNVAPPAAASEKTSDTEKPAASVAQKGISDWLPWTTRR